jgi:hypothetical protein
MLKKKSTAIAILIISIGFFVNTSWGALAEPVSPGETEGYALTEQACPTFSWSAAVDAAAYRIEVYELVVEGMSRDQMRQIDPPVMIKMISAPAFSWTPSAGECLARGVSYIWYVQGLNASGHGWWSDGKVFEVESQALTVGQKEAVQEVVKEHLETGCSCETDTAVTALSTSSAESKTTSEISAPMDGTEGAFNTRLGKNAGNTLGADFVSGGQYLTFIGADAGYYNNTGGMNNTFIGSNSGYANTEGDNNTFVGTVAGYNNSGDENTFVGVVSGYNNTTGSYNSFFGSHAGYNSAGNSNTGIGTRAGFSNQTGSGNVFLGYEAGYYSTGSNKLFISNSSTNRPLIFGDFDTAQVAINGSLTMITVSSISDERYKRDIKPLDSPLEKVLHLQGVSYEWKTGEHNGTGFREGRQIGLVAQDAEKVLPELVHTDDKGYKSLAYDKIVAVLIEAIKEQQSELKEKDARIAKLEKESALISARFEELSMRVSAVEKPLKDVAAK